MPGLFDLGLHKERKMTSKLHLKPSPSTDLGAILYAGDMAVASIEPLGSPSNTDLGTPKGRQAFILCTLEGPDSGRRVRFSVPAISLPREGECIWDGTCGLLLDTPTEGFVLHTQLAAGEQSTAHFYRTKDAAVAAMERRGGPDLTAPGCEQSYAEVQSIDAWRRSQGL